VPVRRFQRTIPARAGLLAPQVFGGLFALRRTSTWRIILKDGPWRVGELIEARPPGETSPVDLEAFLTSPAASRLGDPSTARKRLYSGEGGRSPVRQAFLAQVEAMAAAEFYADRSQGVFVMETR